MAITDKITKVSNGSRAVPTTLTATRAVGATSISCGALTGWNNTSGVPVHFIIYSVDTTGKKVANSQVDCKGIVSGTTITQIQYKAGTDNGHAIGAVVEAAPTAAWADELYDFLSTSHGTDGSLSTTAVQTALGLGTGALNGWNALGYAPATVTANGNRSYDLVFNGTDLTGTLSPGMRLRTQRTVVAPTQSTSLNGTSQYFSKTSPAGMTFTNNFVVGAWVKLAAYNSSAVQNIVSRFNGTSGWQLRVETSGAIGLVGYNGSAGNFKVLASYQSLPLNKWVHVTAQLDMTVATNSPTVNYVMFDGVDVPAVQNAGGTIPTALVQAGNLEIGGANGGLQPFIGKIAQAFVSSAKITQANVRTLMSQGLTSALITANSIISAYSFNNSINDLNTTNANNLTANGSAVATNADGPFGGQASGTPSATLDYAIIQAISYSTNTTVTVQVPEGCTIPTSGGVASVVYSSTGKPYGMPLVSNILALARVPNYVTTASTTDVDVSGLSIPVYVPTGGQSIDLVLGTILYSTSAGDPGLVSLYEDGVLAESIEFVASGNSYYDYRSWEFTRTPAAGLHTYKIMVNRPAGTGTMRFGGESATRTGFLKARLSNQ